jgi:hypothetical protein
MWAKDYWYEGIDLLFTMAISGAIMWRYVFATHDLIAKIGYWVLFWFSTAIKFMTIPLAPVFLLVGKGNLKREIISSIAGFLTIWLIPLAYFRTALSVSVVFHLGRPLKYGSFGAFIIKAINDFTHTEIQTDILPHLPMAGPITSKVESFFGVLFPMAIGFTIIYLSYRLWRKNKDYFSDTIMIYSYLIKATLIYFLVLFMTTKVFSSPFHIWYVTLLAMFPYRYLINQIGLFLLSFFMLGLDTTTYFKVSATKMFGPFLLERIRDAFRFVPMMVMIWLISRTSPVINSKSQ